jgi:hypothetical protein
VFEMGISDVLGLSRSPVEVVLAPSLLSLSRWTASTSASCLRIAWQYLTEN